MLKSNSDSHAHEKVESSSTVYSNNSKPANKTIINAAIKNFNMNSNLKSSSSVLNRSQIACKFDKSRTKNDTSLNFPSLVGKNFTNCNADFSNTNEIKSSLCENLTIEKKISTIKLPISKYSSNYNLEIGSNSQNVAKSLEQRAFKHQENISQVADQKSNQIVVDEYAKQNRVRFLPNDEFSENNNSAHISGKKTVSIVSPIDFIENNVFYAENENKEVKYPQSEYDYQVDDSDKL